MFHGFQRQTLVQPVSTVAQRLKHFLSFESQWNQHLVSLTSLTVTFPASTRRWTNAVLMFSQSQHSNRIGPASCACWFRTIWHTAHVVNINNTLLSTINYHQSSSQSLFCLGLGPPACFAIIICKIHIHGQCNLFKNSFVVLWYHITKAITFSKNLNEH